MHTPFQDHVAVVTGGAGAIGQAIAARLFAGGARLCLLGRTEESLQRAADTFAPSSGRIRLYPADLEDDVSIATCCDAVGREHKSVAMLVHCAGVLKMNLIRDGNAEEFDRQYRVNVRAPYLLTQGLLPRILDARGQVVFVNSSAGLNARKGAAQYAASKHALRGLADSLREEVNEHGVRVTSIFLGRTASRMQAAVYEREGRTYKPEVLLQPDDVAAVVVHALGLPRTAEVTDISMRPAQKTY